MTDITQSLALAESLWPEQEDSYFNRPYIDLDEPRDSPVAHRYVHGGFEGTDTRFSFYFPTSANYDGRFFQHVTPVPQSENLAVGAVGEEDKIGFAASSGAYFVETNGGGPSVIDPTAGVDPSIGAFRVSAAAARFSRDVAQRVYGYEHRPYGYLYGGSGGSYRTIGAAENTVGVWDGYVPYVIATPLSIPNNFSVRMHAQRILRDSFDRIVEAHDAGGDPASLDLTDEERAAFTEVTKMGFPPRSWFGWKTMGMHGFSALYPGVLAADPTYPGDFWTAPGYLGSEADSSVHRDRIQLSSHIDQLIHQREDGPVRRMAGGVDVSFLESLGEAGPVTSIRLADEPAGWALGAELRVVSGAAAGAILRLSAVEGTLLRLEPGQDVQALAKLMTGDEVLLDNSNFLAAQTYHRHQVPGPEYGVWDQFRDQNGEPLYPQRLRLLGPLFAAGTAGTVPSGAIEGKMIAVLCLLDREAFPWHGDWFKKRVVEHLGGDAANQFRLWYVDNALHGDSEAQEFPTRTVSFLGVLQTALRQVAAWAERAEAPADDSAYDLVDGQVIIPNAAVDRFGVQPAVTMSVNGRASTTVRVGESVEVRVEAAVPVGNGLLVRADCDVTGSGQLDAEIQFEPAKTVSAAREATFSEPGTYYLAARVTSQSDGDSADPFGRVHNIARVRVDVVA